MVFLKFEMFLVIFILVLTLLYKKNGTFLYYFKYILYVGLSNIIVILVLPIFMFRPKNIHNLLIASYTCSWITKIVEIHWELRGKEHLEQDRGCIIVSNHQSAFDILGMYQIWPIMKKCTAIARRELFYVWPFGLAAWLAGLIFIDRRNAEKARLLINDTAKYVKEKKIKLWIYPEGTRRNTGEIHPFKKGAFYAAIHGQIPILPIVFSSYYFLSSKEKKFDSGRVIIKTLPAISTEGMTIDDVNKLLEKTQNVMSETLRELNREIQSS